jgi:hypothetical protein
MPPSAPLNEKDRSGQERPFSNIFADNSFRTSSATLGQTAQIIKRRVALSAWIPTQGIFHAIPIFFY